MAVTIDSGYPKRTGQNSWLYQFESDQADPVFMVYRGGRRVATIPADPTTGKGTYRLTTRYGESPAIEIKDGTEVVIVAAATNVELRWPVVSGAIGYRVEQYIDGSWQTVSQLKARPGGAISERFVSQTIADTTSTQLRVTAIGAAGILGTPGSVTFEIARHPDPPAVSMTYDNGTNTVTIAAAA